MEKRPCLYAEAVEVHPVILCFSMMGAATSGLADLALPFLDAN